MSTVGIVGLAWALMTTAAFAALSASAMARTRHELEVDPRGANSEGTLAREHSQSVPMRAPAHTYARAQWPAIEMTPASPVLRSSPSVARMHAIAGRAGPINLS
jgi:hypothetical protein